MERWGLTSTGSLLDDGQHILDRNQQPAVIFHLYQKLLGQNLVVQDAGPPLGRDDVTADGGLGVSPEEVVHPCDGRLVAEGAVSAAMGVVVDPA